MNHASSQHKTQNTYNKNMDLAAPTDSSPFALVCLWAMWIWMWWTPGRETRERGVLVVRCLKVYSGLILLFLCFLCRSRSISMPYENTAHCLFFRCRFCLFYCYCPWFIGPTAPTRCTLYVAHYFEGLVCVTYEDSSRRSQLSNSNSLKNYRWRHHTKATHIQLKTFLEV